MDAAEFRSQRRNKEKTFETLIPHLKEINRVDLPPNPTRKIVTSRQRLLKEK
ncbi:MAG: hypothetical protein ACE5HN_02020 [Nitrospiria bacterium]